VNKRSRTALIIPLLLMAGTILCYWQVASHEFVAFDDAEYISENPHVKSGLTWSGIIWAFTSNYASNWHPLTWLSHMLDCQLYGLNPAGHHLTNVFLHLVNTLLLFFVLREMTGALWRSAAVAALFAWHPVHVESVAWASERKDVLSTLFFLLTIWAYCRYVEGRGEKGEGRAEAPKLAISGTHHESRITPLPSSLFYLLALLFFALGLMSKPMLVTLPCLLLLLDVWPLGRVQLTRNFSELRSSLVPLIREKLPFFALTMLSIVVTSIAQRHAASTLEDLSFGSRLANALVAYARYISKTVWPSDLAAIYPYSRHLPVLWVAGAALLLLSFSGWFLARAQRNPYLIVGWLWFLGTLVPTIGLVQVGSQSMADRYMYIPGIGLFILAAWGLNDLLGAWRHKQQLLAVAAIAVLAGCLVCTWTQVTYWRDSESLFRRAMNVTAGNYIAYDGLGSALNNAGRREEALKLLYQAVKLNPRYPEGHYDLGTALMQLGRLEEAIPHFEAALRHNPKFASAHNNLGTTLLRQGKVAEAAEHFHAAVTLNPEDPEAFYNLGTVLMTESKVDEAVACFLQALRLKPGYWEAESNLGIAFARQGHPAEARSHFAEAVRLNPNNPQAHFNLGLALLELNQPTTAAEHFSEAARLNPDDAKTHYHLALALSRQGNSNQAVIQAKKALDLARTTGQTQLAAQAEELLKSAHSGKSE
jgi:tetratricopeptide (TPR) repeat protein